MSNGASPSSSSSSYFHFLAGLASGTTSAVLLQPADLLKTRIQQSRESARLVPIVRQILSGPSPLTTLWRGTAASAVRTGLGSALYFSSLNALRRLVASSSSSSISDSSTNSALSAASAIRNSSSSNSSSSSSTLPRLSPVANLATGALARASVGMVMMPVTVLKVRYESSFYNYGSLAGAARAVLARDGVRGLFAGWGATVVRDAPYAGLYVVFYEACKAWLTSTSSSPPPSSSSSLSLTTTGPAPLLQREEAERGKRTKTMEDPVASARVNFVSGAAAAAAATAVTNPFDAVKTRIQLMPNEYRYMGQAALRMLREEGAVSLADGMALRMARKAISSALAWTVYEELIRRAERRWDD